MLGAAKLVLGRSEHLQFLPDETIDRAHAAAFIVRAFALPAPGGCAPTFVDVGCDHPFYADVEAMAAAGVTSGYADGTFGPDLSVARSQFVAFMVRASGLAAGAPPTPSYADVPASHTHFGSIEAAAAEGWMDGESDGSTFQPDAATNRRALTLWMWNLLRERWGL
jgi:hypothetical protein